MIKHVSRPALTYLKRLGNDDIKDLLIASLYPADVREAVWLRGRCWLVRVTFVHLLSEDER